MWNGGHQQKTLIERGKKLLRGGVDTIYVLAEDLCRSPPLCNFFPVDLDVTTNGSSRMLVHLE